MRIRTAALALLLTPAIAASQLPDADARDRADSIAVASVFASLVTDSLAAAQRARVVADSLLNVAIPLWDGAPALTDGVRAALRARAWLLYLNPDLRLRLTPVAGTPAAGRELLAGTVDSIRAFLRARGVNLDRVSVAPIAQSAGAPAIGFTAQGEIRVATIPAGEASPPQPTRVGRPLWRDREERYRWGTVRIFYATDRQRSGQAEPETFYSGRREPNGVMEFGRVEVTVPRIHRPGVVERPVWYRLERSTDTDRHMTVREVQPLGQRDMHDSIRTVLGASGRREALVFIHGYNVSFADAAMRTAQLAYDVGFDGAPILYSWPSRGSIFRYSADRENAEFSAQHLAVFLDSIAAITGSRKVHVIAHSMGNRALTLALEQLALQGRDTLLDNIVLAAADVDAGRFQQQIAPRIRGLARRITVYMSGQDKALRASRLLSTNLRLGEANAPVLVVEGTETIDASAIPVDLLGHGYIASAAEVVEDLLHLLGGQQPPRARLHPLRTPDGARYWVLAEGNAP